MLEKKIILNIPDVYTANAFIIDGRLIIGAGSEKEHPAYLLDVESNSSQKITEGPGGMMSLVSLPGKRNEYYSVMGLFPPFIGAGAGVFRHRISDNGWITEKVLSLPFAHRCEILHHNNENHIFIATVSIYKENPGDWSKPGELYHAVIPDNINAEWETDIIIDNLYRNHGMTKININGSETICISGDAGIFSILPSSDNSWGIEQLFTGEVSEFTFFDFDGDGQEELAVIEPFHGDSLSIYKKTDSIWRKIYGSPLSFGHGLSSGLFKGQRVIVTGNRRGSEAIEMHTMTGKDQVQRIVIEENVGPTQTKIFRFQDKDFILSSNQLKNEVALYY
jgi:hypothetical protein